jgi:hypothetical protein
MTEKISGGSLGQAEKGETRKGGSEILPESEINALVSECDICKSEIKKGAKKCTRCNSFQHPVRRFFAGMDVKSLVALVPIVTLAFVFVKDRIVVHKSDLRITIMDVNRDGVRIAVSNLGDRAAILHEGAELVFVVNGVADPRPRLLLKDPNPPGVPLIKPGESSVLEFLAVGKDNTKIPLDACPPDGTECIYKVSFHTIAFDHEPQTVVQSYVARGGTP